MPRLTKGVERDERQAAGEVLELADLIQDCCYYGAGRDVSQTTIRELHRAYRILKPVVEFYFGSDHCLVYDAPTGRFMSKGAK